MTAEYVLTKDEPQSLPDHVLAWPYVARAEPEDQRWKAESIRDRLVSLFSQRGERYRGCTLDNFQATTPEQSAVVAKVQAYVDDIEANISRGVNVVLIGPSGTGKDHLLASMFRPAIQATGCGIVWHTGPGLYAAVKAAERIGEVGPIMRSCLEAPMLAISDPVGPLAALTPWQAGLLYQVVDERYNKRLPVWTTINVGSRAEANERLGASIVDRLVDGALSLACSWPSYRRSQ